MLEWIRGFQESEGLDQRQPNVVRSSAFGLANADYGWVRVSYENTRTVQSQRQNQGSFVSCKLVLANESAFAGIVETSLLR